MKLYYCPAVDDFDYTRAEALIDPQRLARTLRLPPTKRPASFVAGLLLRYGLLKANIPYHQLRLLPNGKPYLLGEAAYISISHSAHHAICGVDRNPIGVDIQTISMPRERLIRRVCSLTEQEYIHRAPCPATAFTCLWVLKESYVKLLGCGIGTDLAAISFIMTGDQIQGPEGYRFQLSYEVKGAVIGVCIQNPPQGMEAKHL